MIHSEHFEEHKTYKLKPVTSIPIGAEILVVDKFDWSYSGRLKSVGELECFVVYIYASDTTIPFSYESNHVYHVSPLGLCDVLNQSITL